MERPQTRAPLPQDDVLWFIHDVRRLTSADAILDATFNQVGRYGFETLLVSGPRNVKKRNEEVIVGRRMPANLVQRYVDWNSEYSNKQYAGCDPMVRRMQTDWRPFYLTEVSYDSDRDPREDDIRLTREDLTYADVLVVPVFDLNGLSGFLSMSGPDANHCGRVMPALHLLSTYVFHQIQSLSADRKAEKPLLTAREREVLTWVARGKTAWDIGEILDIAKRTVDEHVQSVCRKLGAVNRAQAVALAIRDRHISL